MINREDIEPIMYTINVVVMQMVDGVPHTTKEIRIGTLTPIQWEAMVNKLEEL